MNQGFSINDFLRTIGFPLKHNFLIDSREALEKAVETFGILPFFPNNIKGLSIEEMCAPGMLFGGNYEEGCWEWKGPVIRKGKSMYGKVFRRKAGFVSLDLIPDFLNYRRASYPLKKGGMEEMLLEIIRENDSLSSTELKKLIFGNKERTSWDELPEIKETYTVPTKKKSLESPLQKLQMGGWIIISDFEYKRTKRGERYGWGVARYSTPELVFGDLIRKLDGRNAEQSLNYIVSRIKKTWPSASKNSIITLLK